MRRQRLPEKLRRKTCFHTSSEVTDEAQLASHWLLTSWTPDRAIGNVSARPIVCGSVVLYCVIPLKNLHFHSASSQLAAPLTFPRCGCRRRAASSSPYRRLLLIAAAAGETRAAFELWPVNSSPRRQPGNCLCGSGN